MTKALLSSIALTLALAGLARAADQPKADEETRRAGAIADFTRKMKEANYPALFAQAAQEFNVPADILKGVAFAETRWEHLTWPPGETESPETGMPRSYGIMSLWDNKYFGHSLLEAAQLLGIDPEVLKQDPLQNIRGGAALLRKIYDETPKPAGTTEADLESWRYAIRKYCGIPEPDLNAQHALKVYIFINQGYHQYGIEWDARPINLDPIREETQRIVAEEKAKRAALQTAETNVQAAPSSVPSTGLQSEVRTEKPGKQPPIHVIMEPPQLSVRLTASRKWLWLLLGGMTVIIGGALVYIRHRRTRQ